MSSVTREIFQILKTLILRPGELYPKSLSNFSVPAASNVDTPVERNSKWTWIASRWLPFSQTTIALRFRYKSFAPPRVFRAERSLVRNDAWWSVDRAWWRMVHTGFPLIPLLRAWPTNAW